MLHCKAADFVILKNEDFRLKIWKIINWLQKLIMMPRKHIAKYFFQAEPNFNEKGGRMKCWIPKQNFWISFNFSKAGVHGGVKSLILEKSVSSILSYSALKSPRETHVISTTGASLAEKALQMSQLETLINILDMVDLSFHKTLVAWCKG